jgi:hypothetical protein
LPETTEQKNAPDTKGRGFLGLIRLFQIFRLSVILWQPFARGDLNRSGTIEGGKTFK